MKLLNDDGTPVKPFNEHGTQTPKFEVGDWSMHGDVTIFRIEELPAEFSKAELEPMSALAYGESAQHLHQLQGQPGIDFEAKILPTGERLLRIVNPTALKHQEHSPIVLPPGLYRTGIQREYSPFDKRVRQVID